MRPTKKKKQKTVAKLIEEVAVILQRLVRVKAADANGLAKCVTCGIEKHWKELQGGHFISREHIATKILEENIHPQCRGCNGPRRGDSLVTIRYMQNMIEMYGMDSVYEMIKAASKGRKYAVSEVLELKQFYMNQLNNLEQKQ